MDSFDNKVTKMERDILEIRNNIDCVKSKNHKTIYSIVESINTLSKNNSKKKSFNNKKKEEHYNSTKDTSDSKNCNKENINNSNYKNKLNYRNQDSITLNKQYYLNNMEYPKKNLTKNYSTLSLKSYNLQEFFSNNKEIENYNKTSIKGNYFKNRTSLKYNSNNNRCMLNSSINKNTINNNNLNDKGYLYKKYQNYRASISLREKNESSYQTDNSKNNTFEIFQKPKIKEEYNISDNNNSKEIMFNNYKEIYKNIKNNNSQKQKNCVLDISEYKKKREKTNYQILDSPKIDNNIKKVVKNTRNTLSKYSQSYNQKSPRINSAYQRQRLNPYQFKLKNDSCRNNSYDYNSQVLNKYNEKYVNQNFLEKEKNQDKNKLILEQIKKILNIKNNDDIINKIYEYKKYEELFLELKNLFEQHIDKNFNSENLFHWINKLNEKSVYYNYCLNIMHNYNIHSFEELKKVLDKFFAKNRRNENFVYGMKKILCSEYPSKK